MDFVYGESAEFTQHHLTYLRRNSSIFFVESFIRCCLFLSLTVSLGVILEHVLFISHFIKVREGNC